MATTTQLIVTATCDICTKPMPVPDETKKKQRIVLGYAPIEAVGVDLAFQVFGRQTQSSDVCVHCRKRALEQAVKELEAP